jgi:signal transduction histidine kinase
VTAAPATRFHGGRGLIAGLVVAAVLVIVAGELRWLVGFGADGLGRLRVLFAIAFLLVAALLVRRAASWAWAALVMAAGISAIELVAGLRFGGLLTDSGSNVGAAAGAGLALVAAASVAGGYAGHRREGAARRWNGLAALAGAAAVLCVAAASVWAVAAAASGANAAVTVETAPIRIAGRLAVAVIGMGLVIGVLRDALPVGLAAYGAWRAQPAAGPRTSFASHLAEAVAPARAAQPRMAREDERARLAADLHATVLPQLRRAAAAVSTEAVPEDVRAGVRRALEDVEQLMHGRQSIVLEQFGLVAALEWLAERTEQGATLRVEVELDGELIERGDAIPPAIARAAFRIALLAVDNAARHATASVATIRLHADDRSIELSISDDGAGTGAGGSAGHQGGVGTGRGIADMEREARATGGTFRTTAPPAVTVTATWPARATA